MLYPTSSLFWEQWTLYHKVTFDGVLKTIRINDGEVNINVKEDIYSSWKEWVRLEDNAKYLPAIRTIGGDPVAQGQYAGDMYFLMNGWQIVIPHNVTINGILYHDDIGTSPFYVLPGGGVISKVSNLAFAYDIPFEPSDVRIEMDTNSTKLNSISNTVSTIPADTWNIIPTTPTTGSYGEIIFKKLLRLAHFIGLK